MCHCDIKNVYLIYVATVYGNVSCLEELWDANVLKVFSYHNSLDVTKLSYFRLSLS